MLQKFQEQGCLMSINIHFLNSHLGNFTKNLGDYSEEQGERFHQDIKEMERHYQGRWDKQMMADFCWLLKRAVAGENKKKERGIHSVGSLTIKEQGKDEQTNIMEFFVG